MTKNNMHIALSSLILLSATANIQAAETGTQAEDLLNYSSLGTGEEIREEILADANPADAMPQDDDDQDEDQDEDLDEEDVQWLREQKRRKAESGRNNGNMGNKSTQGKCGEDTCS